MFPSISINNAVHVQWADVSPGGLRRRRLRSARHRHRIPWFQQIWNKYMPQPNNFNTGDAHNVEGFQGQVSLPENTEVPGGPHRP